jgi:hypothetical protein
MSSNKKKNTNDNGIATDDDKDKKRKKQFKRMGRLLGKIWEALSASTDGSIFRTDCETHNLAAIGSKIDAEAYRFGKHGWEAFARDVGSVFNVHVQRYVAVVARSSRSLPHCVGDCVCDMSSSSLLQADDGVAKSRIQSLLFILHAC